MKKIIVGIILLVVILIGGYFFFHQNEDIKKDPIEEIMDSYQSYTFHDINIGFKDDLFKIKEYDIKYNTSDQVNYDILDAKFTAQLIDYKLHLMYNNQDHIINSIGNIYKIMLFKSCNCNNECIKLIVLNDEGKAFYLDILENINNLDNPQFIKIESDEFFSDIGYIENIVSKDLCGANGLVLITYKENKIYYDNNFEILNQDYYTILGYNDKTLYVYPDGSLKYLNTLEVKYEDKLLYVSEGFIDDKFNFYVIDKKGYLYQITPQNDNYEIKRLNQNIVSKIGYLKTDKAYKKALVIYEDASAKIFNLDDNSNILK